MLNHALKIAHLGNWQSDIRTNRVKWSEEVYSIFGISKEMFGGYREDFFELVHPEDRARVREFVVQIFEEDAIQEIEYRIIRSDGEIRFVAVRADLIRNSKGEATQFFGTIQDVTEKKLTEERLGQSQKMEAVGQLAGGLAHDFNNLLNVILANLDLLEIKLKDSPELLKRVNSGQDAVQRGVELNRRLLSFSRKQPINPEVFDVNKLLFDFVPILERLETEKVGLEFEISQEFLPCEIEKNGMENALLNLAINARDAMPEGGTIRISSGLLKNASTEGVRISGLNSADYCLVTVTDTGIGMAEEIKAHIFEPFFSTKGSGKGSGLGLSMVYGFVKQSKGFIKVISVPGHGTSFLLFLPIYNSYPETPQNPGAILP
ncbi:PAS domain-containing sensor histidine kinase [Leptospira fluminis]|uniref:histidine kinase n=2 Tax=Leptospira fluminis TaxID=2484979 RepID=A0A4R9GPD5_9LEPT|nr:PAS domain-containing sensor histidine kinase [Leptospira fluminis]